MFYLKSLCPICQNGVVGFYRCSDGKTIVFLCTECGTVWDDYRIDQSDPVQFLNEVDAPLPGRSYTLGGDVSGWATRPEIESAKLAQYIAGESERS